MSLLKYTLTFLLGFMSFWGFSQTKEIHKTTLNYKDTLQLDFYSSKLSEQKNYPLLVLVHGGGFASGSKDGPNETKFCLDMAKRGYPVVSINYRLTRKNDPFNCDCDSEKKIASFVAGAEDLDAAMKFLNSKKDLDFDRESVVLIGSSAGAELILHAVFMNSDYRFSHISPIKATGIISLSGAMVNSSYINKNNAVPSLFIHGKKDDLVPYETAPHHFCEESRKGYLMLDGPITISEKLKKQNTSFIIGYNNEGNHDWADIGYLYTNLMHQYIQDHMIHKNLIQSYIELQEDHTSINLSDE